MARSTVLVSGAGSGIGKAVAESLADKGFDLALLDIDGDAVAQVAESLNNGITARSFEVDVSEEQAMRTTTQDIKDSMSPLLGAVNNAGVGGANAPTGDYGVEEWRKVLSVNLDGVFMAMRYQIPAMVEQGRGRIVNIASILGQVGFSGAPAYVAAKHGVVGLTKNAAQEYATQGVRVNAVGPGFIQTPLLGDMEDEAMEQIVAMHPIGRLGRPDEVASLVTWLVADAPEFLTGAYIPIDGGYLTR